MKMLSLIHHYHRSFYLFGLYLLVSFLPLSRFMVSVSMFFLILNWLIEGSFRNKARLLLKNRAALIFASIILVYAAGLFYTQDFHVGYLNFKNVLCLMVLPIIMGSSDPLLNKEIKRIFIIFVLAVILASLICLVNYILFPEKAHADFRNLSLFMLHIRFSFLIIMAILVLLYLVFYNHYPLKKYERIVFVLMAVILTGFLFFFRSFTGIMLYLITISLFFLRTAFLTSRRSIRIGIFSLLILLSGTVIFTCVYMEIRYFHAPPIQKNRLDKRTINGNPYVNNNHDLILENGNYVNLYVCEPELKKEWDKISKIAYEGHDLKGQDIRYTIRRYLTSKGLRKDSAGLSKLGEEDIRAIEEGSTNYHFNSKNHGLIRRLYETLWEIDVWRKTGYVNEHSFTQRIIFLKAALEIVRENPWTGVGTGDVYDAMHTKIDENKITVEKKWMGRVHDQYGSWLVSFGIIGFLWIMFSLIYPVIQTKAYHNLLFSLFLTMIFISMLGFDTLESYDTIVFFTFFYLIFLTTAYHYKRL